MYVCCEGVVYQNTHNPTPPYKLSHTHKHTHTHTHTHAHKYTHTHTLYRCLVSVQSDFKPLPLTLTFHVLIHHHNHVLCRYKHITLVTSYSTAFRKPDIERVACLLWRRGERGGGGGGGGGRGGGGSCLTLITLESHLYLKYKTMQWNESMKCTYRS